MFRCITVLLTRCKTGRSFHPYFILFIFLPDNSARRESNTMAKSAAAGPPYMPLWEDRFIYLVGSACNLIGPTAAKVPHYLTFVMNARFSHEETTGRPARAEMLCIALQISPEVLKEFFSTSGLIWRAMHSIWILDLAEIRPPPFWVLLLFGTKMLFEVMNDQRIPHVHIWVLSKSAYHR